MMNKGLLIVTCFAISFLPALAQPCDADGCDELTVVDLREAFSGWWSSGFDCNQDTYSNILDLTCILNQVPNFAPPVLDPIAPLMVNVGDTLSVTMTASDPNDDDLFFSAANLPTSATLAPESGLFLFTPDAEQIGNQIVTFSVSDGLLHDHQEVALTVLGGLVALPQSLAVQEDGGLAVLLTSSGDNGMQTYEVVDGPTHGSLSGAPPNLNYTPFGNYHGQDSFSFVVLEAEQTSDPALVQITVTPRNDAPRGLDQVVVVEVDQAAAFTLTATDPENDPLFYGVETQPSHGILSGSPPNLSYTPNPGFAGNDSLTFLVEDGQTTGTNGTVTIRVIVPSPILDQHDPITTEGFIQISGSSVADRVEISGPAADLDVMVEGGRFQAQVPLKADARNTLFFTPVSADSRGAPSATTVIHDTRPPSLSILLPASGAELTSDGTDVAGTVGDLLSGFMGIRVTVNGQEAVVDEGIGANGSFFAENVPLNANSINDLEVVATDAVGNQARRTVTVRQADPAADQPILSALSGNAQEGVVETWLADPIQIQVTTSKGLPFANKLVTFRITRSDGLLAIKPGGEGVQQLAIRTDADGQAAVYWRMGMDAGCGNNRVEVTSTGVLGRPAFCASAASGAARQINLGSGDSQRIEVGGPACEPLQVWVNDSCNGVAGVPVTFTVLRGSGSFGSSQSITVDTTGTGHAQTNFTMGNTPGATLVQADFPGNPGNPVVFTMEGLVRDERLITRLTGLVIDNSGRPIGGVRCHLTPGGQDQFTVTTSQDGRFSFDGVPDGPAGLSIDGMTATTLDGQAIAPGSFPSLHFTPVLAPNLVNTLNGPVKLPRLQPQNAVIFDNTQDVVLTVEGIEGLQMHVQAGSMRRADGSIPSPADPALLSLNTVHPDDVPMPMPDGAAPPLAWTLQPGGSTFDPPIRLSYPNMSGLAPGALAWFLSFDHDTNRFEIVATGSVSEDGATINSDPGKGLTVAGWGCNCPPYSVTGTCEPCPPGTGGEDCTPCPRGTTGPNCSPCPPGSTDPNCAPCPPGTQGTDCEPCPDGICDENDEEEEGCDVEDRCLKIELADEIAGVGNRAKPLFDVINRVPILSIEPPNITGAIAMEGCSGCCDQNPVDLKKASIGGQATLSTKITVSNPRINDRIGFNSSCGYTGFDFDIFLGVELSILLRGITLGVYGEYNGCKDTYCIIARANGSIEIGFGLAGVARVTANVCDLTIYDSGIEARLGASLPYTYKFEYKRCTGDQTLMGCVDKLKLQGSIKLIVPFGPDLDFEYSTSLWNGTCESGKWDAFAGFGPAWEAVHVP